MSASPPIATKPGDIAGGLFRANTGSEAQHSLLQHWCLDWIRGCRWSRNRAEVKVHAQLHRAVLTPESQDVQHYPALAWRVGELQGGRWKLKRKALDAEGWP